jgi:DNA polymerase-3 subunit delta'
MTKEEISFANNFSKYVNPENITELIDIFDKAHYHIERNANAKIILTDMSFKIMKSIRK